MRVRVRVSIPAFFFRAVSSSERRRRLRYAVDDESRRSTRVSEVVKACEAAFVDSNTSADASAGRREIDGFSYSEETNPAAYDV